jgi:glycosyltransferase involved in cell wall biosynthesis
MPEVAGQAALMVDPFDSNSITRAMLSITSNAGLRRQMIAKGRTQAEKFSWAQMAQAVLNIYKETENTITEKE